MKKLFLALSVVIVTTSPLVAEAACNVTMCSIFGWFCC